MKPKRWAVVALKLIVDKRAYRLKRDGVRWPDDSEVDYYVPLRSVSDRKIVSQSSVAGLLLCADVLRSQRVTP